MKDSLKRRGQRFSRRFSKVSRKASTQSKEHIKENLIGRISHIKNIKLLIFEWILLIVSLIVLASLQAVWFGNSYEDVAFIRGGTYTEATLGQVTSLNPLFATTDSERVLSKLLFATLTNNDYSGHPGLGLASSVRASEDNKTWTIKIRDNIYWSDGEQLTVDDVMFTLGLIQNPAINSTYSPQLNGVKISRGENNEIVFKLPSAYTDFISTLNIPVVPKHILENTPAKTLIDAEFSTMPVTSGAFTFNAVQTGSSENEKIFYLSANPNYYLGRPMLDSFAVHTYDTNEDIIAALDSNSVTATAELSSKEAMKVDSRRFLYKDSSINWGTFIFFNLSSSKTSNVELRRAIRQGINLEVIRAAAPDTLPMNFPIIDSQMKVAKPGLPASDRDASSAKIAEIRGEGELKLRIATVNDGFLPDITQKLAEELNGLGIETVVDTYVPGQEFIMNVISKRNYDILVYNIELGADPDPSPYYHSSQTSGNGLNLSNYKNSLVDDLLVGAREATDEAVRAKKYETFLEYWVNDVPAIGLYQSNLTYIYNKNVQPYHDDVRLVTPMDRFVDITSWAASKGTKNKTP